MQIYFSAKDHFLNFQVHFNFLNDGFLSSNDKLNNNVKSNKDEISQQYKLPTFFNNTVTRTYSDTSIMHDCDHDMENEGTFERDLNDVYDAIEDNSCWINNDDDDINEGDEINDVETDSNFSDFEENACFYNCLYLTTIY